jgi:CBS domain-containing protein
MAKNKPDWSSLTARDIMRTEVITVAMDASLSEVERLLGEHRIGGLPVTNEAGHIVGVVSMRDLIANYAENPEQHGPRSAGTFYNPSSDEDADADAYDTFEIPGDITETAGDIMTPQVYTVPAEATLDAVAAEMSEHVVHRILVTEDTHIVGFISAMDILRAMASKSD